MRYCKNRKGYIRNNNDIYIHYNSSSYDKDRLIRGLNNPAYHIRHDKPHGLWASPINSSLSWKIWCENEEFNLESLNDSFRFKLDKNAKVLMVNYLDNVKDYLIELDDGFYSINYKLDLDKIYAEYDAMQVNFNRDFVRLHNNNVFYTWDCDSICIWNPDIIKPIK